MYIKTYYAFTKRTFLSHSAYRFDHIIGIFNICLKIFIFWCIYKVLYGANNEIDGITFSMVTTNFILALGLSSAFVMDDKFLPRKIKDGTIANELLRPVNFKVRILFENFGNIGFALVFNFLPAVFISAYFVGIEKPASLIALTGFIIGIFLGVCILWNISFIVQTLSFWFVNVWSISTIKNVFVNVLSGTMFPLWFMPDWMNGIMTITPFSSIYFTPIRIYLGEISGLEIIINFAIQLLWIFLLNIIGNILWQKGERRLVVQGG